ncbi:MAG: glycogen-binding domain-containing protein [Candidatus Zixiibacteriota bacterium]
MTFRLSAPDATDVTIGGSFSNWALRPLKRRRDGIWSVTIRLAPGTYDYKFLVDDQWVTDPENPHTVPDPFGGQNSLRTVTISEEP